MSEISTSPTYAAWGRMKFNPDFHGKQGTPWTTTDEKYLIAHYAADGPDQVSLALERTVTTIMSRACALRKFGCMAKVAGKRNYSKRLRSTVMLAAA